MSIANRQGRIALSLKNPLTPRTRSELTLPLTTADETLGTLTVHSEQENAFQDEDIAILQPLADHLAIAIDNINLNYKNRELLNQAERRERLLRAANDVGRKVTSVLDLQELMPIMVNTIVEEYGFYYAGVFLLDENSECATLRAGYGEAGRAMLAKGHRLQVGGNSMIGDCIRLNEAHIAPDVDEESVHFRNPYLPNTRSEMALPLSFGRKVLGAVTIQSEEEHAFSEDDITTLRIMADHLAVAIQNP
jgi:GAF domain-containing protein